MWLATKIGFFSVTISTVDGRAQFRARVQSDLDELRTFLADHSVELSETLTIGTADYRYRAFVDKERLPEALAALAESVDYSNFKGEIGRSPTQRHKLDAYHEIWDVMHRLQK